MAGSPNALTALHLRYDPTYKTYLSVEQHLVGDHEYAIFSVNPATRAEKWWNLALYEKLGSRFQIQTFTQYYAQQNYLSEPQASQQTTFINATYAFPHSYVTASSQLTNYNMLGPASLGPGTIAGSLDHPSQVQLTASSFQNKIPGLPLFEQIYEGYGFNHDSVGGNQYLQGFPGSIAAADPDARPSSVRRAVSRPARRESSAGPSGNLLLSGLHDDLEHGFRLQFVTPSRSSSTGPTIPTKPTTSTPASTSNISGTRCPTGSARRTRTSRSAASLRGQSTRTSAIRFSTSAITTSTAATCRASRSAPQLSAELYVVPRRIDAADDELGVQRRTQPRVQLLAAGASPRRLSDSGPRNRLGFHRITSSASRSTRRTWARLRTTQPATFDLRSSRTPSSTFRGRSTGTEIRTARRSGSRPSSSSCCRYETHRRSPSPRCGSPSCSSQLRARASSLAGSCWPTKTDTFSLPPVTGFTSPKTSRSATRRPAVKPRCIRRREFGHARPSMQPERLRSSISPESRFHLREASPTSRVLPWRSPRRCRIPTCSTARRLRRRTSRPHRRSTSPEGPCW